MHKRAMRLLTLFLLLSFAKAAATDKFVIFSPPKNGTFLAAKTLSLITGMEPVFYLADFKCNHIEVVELIQREQANGHFVVAHNFTSSILGMLVKCGYKIIFTLRDPRDQLISAMNWLREGEWHWMPVAHIADQNQQIEELIFGTLYGRRFINTHYLSYEEKLKRIPSHAVFMTRFENLVGEEGGGSWEAQRQEIIRLAEFLNVSLSDEQIESIASNIFGGTHTFRKGQVGSWRDYFTQKHKDLFKVLYNDLLIRLGYEDSHYW